MSTESGKIQIPKPRICCIDLESKDYTAIESEGYNLFKGSLGNVTRVLNSRPGHGVNLLLDARLPNNFQEYNILFLDLTNEFAVDFSDRVHVIDGNKSKDAHMFVCRYPTTKFDPRPFASYYIDNMVRKISNRPFVQVIFACGDYHIEYEPVKITNDYPNYFPSEERSIYGFWNDIPLSQSVSGEEVTICEGSTELANLLARHSKNLTYEQTFFHPTNMRREPLNGFIPLLKNVDGQIVSFIWVKNNLISIVFPDIANKGPLILDLLKHILPSIIPELFPYSTQFKWKEDAQYYLPNHAVLLEEHKNIQKKFEQRLEENRNKIKENANKFRYLHDILTETGDKLVHAVFNFLKWLEFPEVIIKDEHSSAILEEDLQVILDEGLLIIETKGIGGTSTDSDCSQISKIKHRRCKERNAFDVFALYIVNHQRYQPPVQRKNPPFTEHQITDAQNDERGLLTTWQLFVLYFNIQDGIITKEQARNQITKYGLISFAPETKVELPSPKEILKDGHVIVIDVVETQLEVGQLLLLKKNDRYVKTKIESIQVDGKDVGTTKNGEIGLKLTHKVGKATSIWIV